MQIKNLSDLKFIYKIIRLNSLFFLLSLTFISAISEGMAVIFLLPALMLLFNDGEYNILSDKLNFITFIDLSDTFHLISILIFILLTSYIIRFIYLYYSTKIAFDFGLIVNKEIIRRILASNELGKTNYTQLVNVLTRRNDSLIFELFFPFFIFVFSFVQMIFISISLILVLDPIYLLVSISIGFVYFLLNFQIKKSISKRAREISSLSDILIRKITEIMKAADQIRIFGAEKVFECEITSDDQRFRKNQAENQILIHSPKLFLEFLVVFIIFILITTNSPNSNLSQLGILAFAFFRMMPIFQSIFSSVSNIRIGLVSFEILSSYLRLTPTVYKKLPKIDRIGLVNVGFAYGDTQVLSDLSHEFRIGDINCVVGASGSGKSTLISLLLGLSQPSGGSITVCGRSVDDASGCLLRNFSFMPQESIIIEGSVKHNVTLGGSENGLTPSEALVMAQLDFDDADKLYKNVEFSGANLSGGQKQRLALARAIYFNRDVLILDEPTSALDTATGEKVVAMLRELAKRKLVIVSTHDARIRNISENILELDK